MSKSIMASESCPMETGINILSGKQNLIILWKLYLHQVVRFNELQRQVGNITTKTLTQQLRALEKQKIIKRTIYPENPPHVTYSLTELGSELTPVLQALCTFGKQYHQSQTKG